MKICIRILIVYTFLGCGGPKQILENSVGQHKEKECVLPKLTKTLDYRSEIEKYKSKYKDTILELESVIADSVEYRTILDLKKSRHFLWIITIHEKESDSILIDCVSTTKWVESKFNIDKCEIIMDYENFDNNGLPKNGGTEIVNFK